MVNDDFTQTLNAFAKRFNVPPVELYTLVAEAIMVGKRCQRMADIEEQRARAKRDVPLGWREFDQSIRNGHYPKPVNYPT